MNIKNRITWETPDWLGWTDPDIDIDLSGAKEEEVRKVATIINQLLEDLRLAHEEASDD